MADTFTSTVAFNNKYVDISSIEVDGIDTQDFPDFCDAYIAHAEYTNGKELTESEIVELSDQYPDLVNDMALREFM